MNRLLTLFLFCGIAGQLCAQIGEPRNTLSLGVNGGVNMSSVSFIPTFKQATKQGITGGLTARYISEKYFALICGIQVEANYAEYGWQTAQEIGETQHAARTLRYVEVPFLSHVAFGWEDGFQTFIHAGPQVSYLLGESSTMTDDFLRDVPFVQYANREKAAVLPVERKLDYGITAGLGFEWNTKRYGRFLVEGRYYLGLSDFFDSGKAADFERSAHRNITLKATYLFDLMR
jgi:hypothetical protein